MNATNQPLILDPMLQSGAVCLGAPVARVLIEWADGRKLRIDLPDVTPEEPEEISLKPTQHKIFDILKASPTRLTRGVVAKAMDRAGIGGKFAGYVSEMVSRGIIFEHDSELTDDMSKPKMHETKLK